jgi:tetratricopeptide (TPR) repeat protein
VVTGSAGASNDQREAQPTESRVHLVGPKAQATESEPSAQPGHPACPPTDDYLDAAEKAYDARSYGLALACAEEALVEDPLGASAEHERAASLAALGRIEEARLAYTHALALDPDDPEILLGAADLYLTHGGSHDNDEIALEYARRGERRARHRHPELLEQLELQEAMALNDLGRAGEALPKLDEALVHEPKDLDAQYERGSALFELCRFAEAKEQLARLLAALPDDAYAHHELGLVLERLAEHGRSRAELARATELDPKSFPVSLPVTAPEFSRLVQETLAKLPEDARRDLAKAPITVQDIPDVEDLTVDDPPLSPTILGLFRGEPLAESVDGGAPVASAACPAPTEAAAIVLYRVNLLRAVRSRDELQRQVEITLLHELGHLRGADDDELRLEGLE